MAEKDIIDQVKESLKDRIISWEEKSPTRYYFSIKKGDIVPVAKFLFEKQGARFITQSGVDTPEGIEILYHFSFDKLNKIVTLKVLISKEKCEVESIAPLIPGASWIEREIYDLLGVKFLNHPDPRRLILPEDWPEGEYPLRQEINE